MRKSLCFLDLSELAGVFSTVNELLLMMFKITPKSGGHWSHDGDIFIKAFPVTSNCFRLFLYLRPKEEKKEIEAMDEASLIRAADEKEHVVFKNFVRIEGYSVAESVWFVFDLIAMLVSVASCGQYSIGSTGSDHSNEVYIHSLFRLKDENARQSERREVWRDIVLKSDSQCFTEAAPYSTYVRQSSRSLRAGTRVIVGGVVTLLYDGESLPFVPFRCGTTMGFLLESSVKNSQ